MMLACAVMVFFGAAACDQGAPHIEVEGVQVVLSPFIIGSASVFILIENTGNGSDTLVSADIDVSGSITELHTFEEGKMQKTDKIRIPARSSVRLKPSGDHIMIYKLPRNIAAGAKGALTLVFAKSGRISTPFEFTEAR